MKKQDLKEIKKAATEFDAKKKQSRKAALVRLVKIFGIWGFILLAWVMTMLLVILIIADPETGVKAFLEVTTLLGQLYMILLGINLFLFLINYVIKKKQESIPVGVTQDPTNNKDNN